MCRIVSCSVLPVPGLRGPANSLAAVTRVLPFWVSLETYHLDTQEMQMSLHKTIFLPSALQEEKTLENMK